jgi:peptidoglycan/xylan/chitin deacetylase (PgdA/CDA1 family)
VHVDLDGLWTLADCYGYPEGSGFAKDPVFEQALPRLLGLFEALRIKATFFIVGRDLEHPDKARAIRHLADCGHEIANHSWSHQFGLEDLTTARLKTEIDRTSEAIQALTGRQPLGFRAPGYAAGPRVLTACSQAGLRYDGSRLPTSLAPILRWLAGRLRARVRRELTIHPPFPIPASRQYGGGGSLDPQWFVPPTGGPRLLRLPLAVSPLLRLPLHPSLGGMLGAHFVKGALQRLARRGQPISYLVHGLDVLDPAEFADRLPLALSRSRPFQIPLRAKLDFLTMILTDFKGLTRIERTRDWFEATVG